MKPLHTIKQRIPAVCFSWRILLGALAMSSIHMPKAIGQDFVFDGISLDSIQYGTPYWVMVSNNTAVFPHDPNTGASPYANNTLTVDCDHHNQDRCSPIHVIGGTSEKADAVQNNTVIIKDSETRGSVFGGWASNRYDIGNSAIATHNHVKVINQSSIQGSVFGGYSDGQIGLDNGNLMVSSSENSVFITDQTETHWGNRPFNNAPLGVYGGFARSLSLMNDSAGQILADNNKVDIDNQSNIGDGYGDVYGGYTQGSENSSANGAYYDLTLSASGNQINIDHQSTAANVYGGYVTAYGDRTFATINNNAVVVDGGSSVGGDYSAQGDMLGVVGGSTGNTYGILNNATLENNSVTIQGDGTTVKGGVYGAVGNGNNVTANGNHVTISGNSFIKGDVVGGTASTYDDNITPPSVLNTNASAINNTVTLNGENNHIVIAPDESQGQYGSIWGGQAIDSNGNQITDFAKTISGNTLNFNRYRGSVAGIYHFENYNWTLPSDVHNGDTLVTITGTGATPVDLSNTKHNIADMEMSDNRLHVGDVITLIDRSKLNTWTTTGYQIHQGQFIVYDATLSQTPTGGTDNPFVLTILGTKGGSSGVGQSAAHINPQSKSYAEGRIASQGLLMLAEDLISTAGINHVRMMTLANDQQANHPAVIPFIIGNGASLRYKTSGHVDVDSLSMAAGFAGGINFKSGHKATLGAFFEYGKGDYDTDNDFAGYTSMRGDGDGHYHGGGIFGRVDFANTGLGHVDPLPADRADGAYLEASVRTGRASSKFNVNQKDNEPNGYRGSYHSQSTYYGGHLAGGYVFNFDDKKSLDTYARYLWLHMNNDTVKVNNEPLHFDAANSHRLQIGGRYNYALNDRFKPFIGAAYEYEFDGKVKAKAYELNLDQPTLKGSTGIFEAGFHFQPKANNAALSIDVTGSGFVGKRQGGGGNVKVKYQF